MSAQHTDGAIRYEYEPGYCDELIARDGMTVAAFVDEPSEANARRLVACWNACDGISTEHLEDDAVRKLVQDRDLLLAQRDELLVALKWMIDVTDEGGFPSGMCLQKARAVLDKATGDTK